MRLTLAFAFASAGAALALSGPAFAGPADDIIAKENCHICHKASTTKMAPSWASLAEKYKSDPGAETMLVSVLKTGKTPDGKEHKKIAASDADLKAVVDVVLSSK